MAGTGTIRPDDITFTSTVSRDNFLQTERTLEEYNVEIVKHFMSRYHNNARLVADKLDIGKTTLYRMLKRSGENATE